MQAVLKLILASGGLLLPFSVMALTPVDFVLFNGNQLASSGEPVPLAMWLIGAGLIGAVLIGRRRS